MEPLLVKAIFLVAFSGLILYVCWPSLRHRRSYGYYRFFAFELILLLFVLNVESWFTEPFGPRQVISWLLLLASLLLAVHGFYILWKAGQPSGGIPSKYSGPREHTTRLVREGAYRVIRHPLYASLVLLAWGIWFKEPSVVGGGLALAASALLVATARAEEHENLLKFGSEYAAYLKMTKRFIPYLF
jgi:protein-S-isoprenylcysteine O-methyltransferase Ste14